MNTYKQQGDIGKIGEEQFAVTLQSYGLEVIDVRDNRKYQAIDVDFLVDGQKVEVKTDLLTGCTGNFALEIITDIEKDKLGWSAYTEADIVVFMDTVNRIMYSVEGQEVRSMANNIKYRTHIDGKYEQNGSYKRYKQAILRLVPRHAFTTLVEETY